MPKIQGIHTGGVIGSVISRPADTQLSFVLPCDGAAVSRTTYAALFAVIGEYHGEGDGSTTFNVPDYRGRFLRGVDGGQGRDPDASSRTAMASGGNTGDAVGSLQGHAFQTHTHTQNSHSHSISNSDSANRLLDTNTAGGVGNSTTGPPTYTTADPAGFLTAASQTATNNNTAASGTHAQATNNESRPVNACTKFWIVWK